MTDFTAALHLLRLNRFQRRQRRLKEKRLLGPKGQILSVPQTLLRSDLEVWGEGGGHGGGMGCVCVYGVQEGKVFASGESTEQPKTSLVLNDRFCKPCLDCLGLAVSFVWLEISQDSAARHPRAGEISRYS